MTEREHGFLLAVDGDVIAGKGAAASGVAGGKDRADQRWGVIALDKVETDVGGDLEETNTDGGVNDGTSILEFEGAGIRFVGPEEGVVVRGGGSRTAIDVGRWSFPGRNGSRNNRMDAVTRAGGSTFVFHGLVANTTGSAGDAGVVAVHVEKAGCEGGVRGESKTINRSEGDAMGDAGIGVAVVVVNVVVTGLGEVIVVIQLTDGSRWPGCAATSVRGGATSRARRGVGLELAVLGLDESEKARIGLKFELRHDVLDKPGAIKNTMVCLVAKETAGGAGLADDAMHGKFDAVIKVGSGVVGGVVSGLFGDVMDETTGGAALGTQLLGEWNMMNAPFRFHGAGNLVNVKRERKRFPGLQRADLL
jgi:hypothetical protein